MIIHLAPSREVISRRILETSKCCSILIFFFLQNAQCCDSFTVPKAIKHQQAGIFIHKYLSVYIITIYESKHVLYLQLQNCMCLHVICSCLHLKKDPPGFLNTFK